MFRKLLSFFTSRFFLLALFLSLQLILIAIFFAGLISTTYGYYYLIVAWAINIPFLIFIINSKSVDTYKLAWMLVVAIIPIGGILYYLLFANKRSTKRQKKKVNKYNKIISKNISDLHDLFYFKSIDLDAYELARAIYKKDKMQPYRNTKTQYFNYGQYAMRKILEDLNKAQKYIFIEYFIIQEGEFWNSILNILIQKQKEGLEIRVLYDDFGCMQKLPYKYYKKLNNLNIQCKVFNRYKPFLNVKMNSRDHRKILIIDGKVSYTGGINLADEYINKEKRFGDWRDNCIRIEGEATFGLLLLFLTNWDNINKIEEDFNKYKFNFKNNKIINNDDSYVLPYGDIPFDYESISEQVYLNIINNSAKYCYISSPYLILTESLKTALINAKRRGVDVRIVIPGIPDKKLTYQITKSYANNLVLNQVKVYFYTPGFNHAKTFISDDKFATVGTINLDLRSMFLHFENNVLLYNQKSILEIKTDFEDMFKKSSLYDYKKASNISLARKFYWGLLRCISSMF